MKYRVENKYIVSEEQLTMIGARLGTVMQQDVHQSGSFYNIRSLYFDTFDNSCMDENDSGIDQRQKFRIRTYEPAMDTLRLEIKAKERGFTSKTSCALSHEECRHLMHGTLPLGFDSRKPLNQLQMSIRCSKMEPKAIIWYQRTAFVHPTGNVRITFDRNIMVSTHTDCFLQDRIDGLIPVLPKNMHVLEVKYDEFLPDFIQEQLQIGGLYKTAFSKYYLGRLAAGGALLNGI